MSTLLGLAPDQLERQGAWHTAREIAQQPAVWSETNESVRSHREETCAFLRPLFGRQDLRVVLTGAGTSAFAGDILAPALSRRLGRRVDAVATTDAVSNPNEYFAEDLPTLLVSFARSGNSPESIAATALADQRLSECHHLVLTCDPDGRLYRDHSRAGRSLAFLMPERANDQGFAMTSSFTSMLLAAWLILGAVTPEDLVDRLSGAAERLLRTRYEHARGLASSGYGRVVYLGSGPLKGLAYESALKMLELTAGAVVTSFDSPMGFRHGPKSILDGRTLAVVYVSGDPYTRRYDLDLLDELRRSMRPEDIVAVAAAPFAGSDEFGVWVLDGLEGLDDPVLALPFVLVAQLLGLYFSLALGRTPDNPFPTKEVNRVVQGVTIHPLEDQQ
ncbi:MAG: SIS domain-containing protein [Rubrobacter sp.]|nr:SIS domain-containing protein [Rubrobacter sp.]